jgi:hypothetical protein
MTALNRAQAHFHKAFRLLAIEDDPIWALSIGKLLDSPLWDLRIAASVAEVPPSRGARLPWSAVIADIDLRDPDGISGIDVLGALTHFPMKITLSGLKSVEAGHRAARDGGARAVLDKTNPETLKRFPATVAKFAALGYMLDGRCPNHEEIICALVEKPPATAGDWAHRFGLVRRRLEQICGEVLECSPKEAIHLHRTLSFIQLRSCAMPAAYFESLSPEEDIGDDRIEAAMEKYPVPAR